MVASFELGLDSFVVCAVIAPLVPRWRDRVGWIVAFGVSDALASLAASLGFGGMALAGIMAIAAVAWAATTTDSARRLVALPILFCLDNLATGVRPLDALPIGLASAGLAAGGFGACSLVCGGLASTRRHVAFFMRRLAR